MEMKFLFFRGDCHGDWSPPFIVMLLTHMNAPHKISNKTYHNTTIKLHNR